MLQCRVVWVVLAGVLAIAAAQTPQPNAETISCHCQHRRRRLR